MRTQIPLTAGWALTIHKSQGMTLEMAEIDVSMSFTFGQVYVAISRVKSLAQLRVIGFGGRAKSLGLCDEVKDFMERHFNIRMGI